MSIDQFQQVPDTKKRLFYGYIVVAAAFIILVLFGGTRFAFGVFFKPVLNEFGWTRALTSGAFSVSWITQGLMGILMGRLNDRFGPRLVMSVCGFFMGLGYLLMSRIDSIWQLYLYYGLIIGIGSAVYVPLVSTVARWFKEKRSMMTGVVVAGAGVGQFLAPPVTDWLIATYEWRMSYIIVGGVVLLFMIITSQFLRRDPVQIGLLPYGQKKSESDESNSQIVGASSREAIRSRQFWLLFLIFFCAGFASWAINVHIVPHATDLGISSANAAIILAMIGGLVIVGRVVWGMVGDKIGDIKTYIMGCFIISSALIWLVVVNSKEMLYFFAPIFGFAWAVAVLSSPLTASYFGLGSHGAILGLVNLGYNMGGALGPYISGRLFDVTGSYQQPFLVDAIVSVSGFVIAVFLAWTMGRQRKTTATD